MLRMFGLRLRRYRVFLIIATVSTFLVLRFARQRHYFDGVEAPIISSEGLTVVVPKEDAFVKAPPAKTALPPPVLAKSSKSTPSSTKSKRPVVPTIPPQVIPERKVPPVKGSATQETVVDIHPGPPAGDRQVPVLPDEPIIHYAKAGEHFPVPKESIIQLPTGSPAKIPKIQFAFDDETTDAKINREKRQNHVKAQFQKSWTGYKTYAWMHDELSPQSGKYRDPFCGWAATLVDGLDTLWIMGLEEEFETAVKAVNKIDFTTTARNEIPVFETTIRYLGGLIAAYDVSGGKFKSLLAKAVELADILMGTFDTPNRMPELYYNWKPAFTSQPHRASTRSNLAELGSLTLEFTRLAQLTKEPRYYDAVARISIALGEYQDRGTKLGGIFPENVDASGCNKTALSPTMPVANAKPSLIDPAASERVPEGYKPSSPEVVRESINPGEGGASILELDVVPGAPDKAHFSGWDDKQHITKRADVPGQEEVTLEKVSSNSTHATRDPLTGTLLTASKTKDPLADWDCIPQGLDSSSQGSSDKFSMGGGQDSTYEYFPKQYLLLGGRVDLYRKMYLETIQAVKKHLLYRPMLPKNPDILFTGSLQTYESQKQTEFILSAEIEHLTCFIGGMVGMAAKIFDLDGDLEIAKKLTEGCVWAYGSTPTGIMPESSEVLPCKNTEHCSWNETTYHHYLDPGWKARDEDVQRYLENQAKYAMEAGLVDPEVVAGNRRIAKRGSTAPTSSYDEKVGSVEAELDEGPTGRQAEVILGKTPSSESLDIKEPPTDPDRPMTHKEYIEFHLNSTRLPAGMVTMRGEAYHLRPEAIESVWYMYRITGDPIWQEKGWVMYENIIKATTSVHGHSAIFDVTADKPGHTDEMESFWLSETLKYFYLLFSTPDTISLDDWVLNTEAHPFKREK